MKRGAVNVNLLLSIDVGKPGVRRKCLNPFHALDVGLRPRLEIFV